MMLCVSIPFISGFHSYTTPSAMRGNPGGLNPFYFRVSFILLPYLYRERAALVSIPFISGFHSYRLSPAFLSPFRGLNPFYFRVSFIRQLIAHAGPVLECLNPFYFRVSFIRNQRRGGQTARGLNPFYFRVSFILYREVIRKKQLSLNPFYFRVSFIRSNRRHRLIQEVSIPFISGFHSYATSQGSGWRYPSQSLLFQGFIHTQERSRS